MGFLDRIMGRGKKAVGDLADDPELHREGQHQEQEGAAEDRAERLEAQAQEERERAAEHRVRQEDL
jgi:uncharacterized protein YjbJ (UPF0337 family)